jgi:hypothetical protein
LHKKYSLSIIYNSQLRENGAGEKDMKKAPTNAGALNQNPKSNSENLSDKYMILLFF